MIVTGQSDIWLTGYTYSNDFPVTNDAYQGQRFTSNGGSYASDTIIIRLTEIDDTDYDGMPDGWEVKFGLNATNSDDATSDLDGDGVSNLEEYLAGTVPNDMFSVPRNRINIWYFIIPISIIVIIGIKITIDKKDKIKSHPLTKRIVQKIKEWY